MKMQIAGSQITPGGFQRKFMFQEISFPKILELLNSSESRPKWNNFTSSFHSISQRVRMDKMKWETKEECFIWKVLKLKISSTDTSGYLTVVCLLVLQFRHGLDGNYSKDTYLKVSISSFTCNAIKIQRPWTLLGSWYWQGNGRLSMMIWFTFLLWACLIRLMAS